MKTTITTTATATATTATTGFTLTALPVGAHRVCVVDPRTTFPVMQMTGSEADFYRLSKILGLRPAEWYNTLWDENYEGEDYQVLCLIGKEVLILWEVE